ncbi:MAG: endonuclease/exonuclease/phosphatase family protein [Flavobacteriales bacterium]|nr:endonuclease/exonuclease/phosphatase family protein [Flavobacteriales bacterium]
MKIPNWLQYTLGSGLILLSVSHWFSLGIWPLELLGAFAHFTVVLGLFVFIGALLLKLRLLAGAAFLSVLTSAALVAPHFAPFPSEELPEFTIAQFNVYHNNSTATEAIQLIAAANSDVFTIQELNTTWTPLLDSIFTLSHPYTVEAPLETCCYGIGIYSKFPIASYEVLEIENTPVVIAQVLINESEVTVISLHTRPPAFPNETKERNRQLEAVANIISTESGHVIVLGDFNLVPWDGEFKSFLEQGNLNAVRNGFQATYPMDVGLPLIPIDHITFSKNLVPTSCQTVTIPGSDHRGLMAGFVFKD